MKMAWMLLMVTITSNAALLLALFQENRQLPGLLTNIIGAMTLLFVSVWSLINSATKKQSALLMRPTWYATILLIVLTVAAVIKSVVLAFQSGDWPYWPLVLSVIAFTYMALMLWHNRLMEKLLDTIRSK